MSPQIIPSIQDNLQWNPVLILYHNLSEVDEFCQKAQALMKFRFYFWCKIALENSIEIIDIQYKVSKNSKLKSNTVMNT